MKTCIETLPSRGVLYGDRLPGGKVEIRAMSTTEEAILTSNHENRLLLLDKIIDNCLITKTVPLAEMLDTDRTYLLFAIRNLTYGSDYTASVRCQNPQCRATFSRKINLAADLRIKVLDESDTEVVEIELPSGITIGVKRLLVSDERAIDQFATRNKATVTADGVSGNPAWNYRLSRYIVSRNGEKLDRTEAYSMFPMAADDSLALQQAVEDFACGLDLEMTHVCPTCGLQFQQYAKVDEEFFRPSSRLYKRRTPGEAAPRPD